MGEMPKIVDRPEVILKHIYTIAKRIENPENLRRLYNCAVAIWREDKKGG